MKETGMGEVEEDEDTEVKYLAEARSEKEYKNDLKEAIRETAKEIEDNAELIIKRPLSKESMGALMMIKETLLPGLEGLTMSYFTSRSEKKVVKKKRARGKKAEDIVYWRDPDEIGWATKGSLMAFFLKKGDEKEDGGMFQ